MRNPKCFRPRTGVSGGFQATARQLRLHAAYGRRIAASGSRKAQRRRGARGPGALGATPLSLLWLRALSTLSHPCAARARLLSTLSALLDSQERTTMCSARACSACSLTTPVRRARSNAGGAIRSQPDHGSDERAQRRQLASPQSPTTARALQTPFSAAACGSPRRQQSSRAHAKRDAYATPSHSHYTLTHPGMTWQCAARAELLSPRCAPALAPLRPRMAPRWRIAAALRRKKATRFASDPSMPRHLHSSALKQQISQRSPPPALPNAALRLCQSAFASCRAGWQPHSCRLAPSLPRVSKLRPPSSLIQPLKRNPVTAAHATRTVSARHE